MKNISVITHTLKVAGEDSPNNGDVIFREIELHNAQPVFVIFSFSALETIDSITEKSAIAFEAIIDTLKANISFGNLEALKIAFSAGISTLNSPANASLVAIIDGALYALTSGLGQVYLKRHSIFAPIVQNNPIPQSESEIQPNIIRSSSGTWHENDIIVLTSSYHPALKNGLKTLDYSDLDKAEAKLCQEVSLEILSQNCLGFIRIIALPASSEETSPQYDNLETVPDSVLTPHQQAVDDSYTQEPIITQPNQLKSRFKKPSSLTIILRDPRKAKKLYGLLTLVFIGVIIVRVFLSFAGVTQESKTIQSQELLTQAQEEYQQALPLITANPPLARNKLVAAQEKIKNILALTPNNQAAKNLSLQIEQNITRTLNVKDTVISEFIKLDLIKNNAAGTSIDLDGRVLNVLDDINGSLYQINIDRKSSEIVGGGDSVKGAKFIAGSLGRTFAYKDSVGVVRAAAGENITATVIDVKDQSWNGVGALASFGGNVYILDNGNNQIWKYTPTESTFSAKTSYLKDTISRDISDGFDMSIDGSVWVLTHSENVYNFLPDSGTSFPISGLDKKIGAKAKIYSDADSTDLVYILDPENSRVIAFGKTGGYRLQYQNEQIANAIDFAVSEKDQTIYLLTPSSILGLKI